MWQYQYFLCGAPPHMFDNLHTKSFSYVKSVSFPSIRVAQNIVTERAVGVAEVNI
jgi:hypothetical protein